MTRASGPPRRGTRTRRALHSAVGHAARTVEWNPRTVYVVAALRTLTLAAGFLHVEGQRLRPLWLDKPARTGRRVRAYHTAQLISESDI